MFMYENRRYATSKIFFDEIPFRTNKNVKHNLEIIYRNIL